MKALADSRLQTGFFLGGTFGWAWLLWGYWVFAMPSGGLQITPAFILCAIIGGFAPSLAALIVSWLIGKRVEVSRLLSAATRSVPLPLLAVTLLLVPAATVVSTLIQGVWLGPLRGPDPALLVMALIWPLMAALGEEIGWRGFLLPRLEKTYGLLGAALLVGLLWGLWHLPADYVALKGYEGWFWTVFLLNGPVVLTAHSIILAWLWRRTGGSVLSAIAYHFTITASAMVAPTAGSEGLSGVLAAAIGAGTIWVAALTLLLFRRRDFR